jgi:hypothetical protein
MGIPGMVLAPVVLSYVKREALDIEVKEESVGAQGGRRDPGEGGAATVATVARLPAEDAAVPVTAARD